MTRSEITFWVFIALALGLSFFALSAIASDKAHATDCRTWPHSEWCSPAQRASKKHRRSKPMSVYERERIRGYRPEPIEEVECAGMVRGVGTQWIGTDGALDAAKKDWAERTRYDLGEAFLDLSHARDFRSRCGRTSIGEVAGQKLYRCELWARPCKALFKESATVEAGK